MLIQMFTVGRFFTNCYVVSCEQTNEAIIIDPGFDAPTETERVFRFIDEKALTLKLIVNTHGHPDHTCGNGVLKKRFHAAILVHEYDAYMLGRSGDKFAKAFGFNHSSPPADTVLHNEDVINFGKTVLKVMHTPGHTRGSISLLGKEEVFAGDTLFAGSIGRTDFPESSGVDMTFSLKKLATLPSHYIVYPGHGPTTTMGEERRRNPFLQSF